MKTKTTRQQEAAERQARHALLTDDMKRAKLDGRGGASARERARLSEPARREHRRFSKPAGNDTTQVNR